MEKKDARAIQAELSKPFASEDLEWRLQQINEEKPWGLAVPYVTNRAIQNRLDDVVGPDRWYNDFKPWHSTGKKESQICGISIFFEDRGWITKWDGAEDSDIEPIKGGLSDSMKRAAVQWGIGRVLYNMDAVFVDVEKRGKTWYIAKKEQAKLDKAYMDMLTSLGLQPAQPGGARPQLTPDDQDKPTKRTSAPKEKPQKPKVLHTPAAAKPEAPAKETPKLQGEDYEYKVVSAQVQEGMSGKNTRLALESRDGKRITAFARGEHPELVPGIMLHGTKLAMKKQDTVVFYILEEYQTITYRQAA